jgi:uridine kinase
LQNTLTYTETVNKKNSFLHSDTQRCFYIEKSLNNIFMEELTSPNSIFKKVKHSTIHKIALFLSGTITRSCSIGLAGETASGKSTIALDIINTIQAFADYFNIKDAITRINTDDYYYDRSEMVKKAGSFAEFAKHYDLDVPEALELELMKKHIKSLLFGDTVLLPEYDMSGTAIRHDNVKLAHPSKIIISEGLFTLTEKIADAFDFKIYVDISPDIQKERFYQRAAERGLGDSADEVYQNASDKAKTHIHPTAAKADIILSGEADRIAYRKFINRILALTEEIYFSNKNVTNHENLANF